MNAAFTHIDELLVLSDGGDEEDVLLLIMRADELRRFYHENGLSTLGISQDDVLELATQTKQVSEFSCTHAECESDADGPVSVICTESSSSPTTSNLPFLVASTYCCCCCCLGLRMLTNHDALLLLLLRRR